MSENTEKPGAASEDAKAKFREALERKKQQSQAGLVSGSKDSGIHGAHEKAGAKREFRRKSGG